MKTRILKPATQADVKSVRKAIGALKLARDHLSRARCPNARIAVRRALKSVEGALRHAERRAMSPKPTKACYWIIGAQNPGQAPAVAIDLHYANGELAVATHTVQMKHGKPWRTRARYVARAYARRYDIPAGAVSYDPDSTAAYGSA